MNKRHTLKRCMATLFYVATAVFGFISIYLDLDSRYQVSVRGMLVQSAIVIFLLSIATFFMVISYAEQKKRTIVVKCSVFILFFYYLFILIYMLFLDKYFGRDDKLSTYLNFDLYFKNNTNFIPFATILFYLNGWRHHLINTSIVLTNLIGNMAAFMPMGIFLPILFKPMKKTWIFIITVGIFIVFVEIIQLITFTGSCDIDDFILNITGAIIIFVFIKSKYIQKLLDRFYIIEGQRRSIKSDV
jgi:glycopeptide antibiotics resistance protein